MELFRNPYQSHEHSLTILNQIYEYDSFLDNLSTIADMGCGEGHDSAWWAELMTRDEPTEPRNYTVYAVDRDTSRFDPDILKQNSNIHLVEADVSTVQLPKKVDFIWAHNIFHTLPDPVKTLATWKSLLNNNGMMLLALPQTTYIQRNQLRIANYNQFYNYNILNLIYLLAINGFDCNDAYFYREDDSPWLYAGVYANDMQPLPIGTSWYELAERKLINKNLIDGIERKGYADISDVVVQWFDKNFYLVKS
jgi:SAM-dependent methyltransferase